MKCMHQGKIDEMLQAIVTERTEDPYYLSEVEDVVVGVGHLPDKEVAVEQADLVELVLVDGVGGGVLRGDEAVGGDHGDVPLLPVQRSRSWRRRLDGGEEAVVVDVVVLLVVDVVVAVRVVVLQEETRMVAIAISALRCSSFPSSFDGGP